VHVPSTALATSSSATRMRGTSQEDTLLHLQTAIPCLGPILQLGAAPPVSQVGTVAMHMLTVLFAFVLVPVLDYLLGEEEAQALERPTTTWQAALYKSVCYVFAALHVTALASAALVASQPTTSWLVLCLLALNCATGGGYAFTVAHELIHSRSKLDRFLGQVLLTTNCYKHWGHSHMAHHAQVGTHTDPASARYREAVRALPLQRARAAPHACAAVRAHRSARHACCVMRAHCSAAMRCARPL
jgi:hypothetical protein